MRIDLKDASPFINAIACGASSVTAAAQIAKRMSKQAHDVARRLKRNARFKKTGKV